MPRHSLGAYRQYAPLALAMMALLAMGQPAHAADVTGPQVKRAIQRGVEAIRKLQQADGSWPENYFAGGTSGLATLALLQADEPLDSDAVASALRYLQTTPDDHTYVAGVKALVYTRADPVKYRAEIEAAAKWLASAQNRFGLWDYGSPTERFDHSNTQFALLGLDAAVEAGLTVPRPVWEHAQQGITRTQNNDGGWAYQATGASYGSMTAAGVADLLILARDLDAGHEHGFRDGAAPNCGHYRVARPLTRGLEWLARNFQAARNPVRGEFHHYWLYAVERCGILSGQKYFGQHDWYRSGATILVRTQGPAGLWNSNLVDTCLAVLFLAKGHKPLLVQKLQWSVEDVWSPDRYDVEHLVGYIADQLGQPVAWQVVPLDAPVEEWLAAPLLYFQGHTFPRFTNDQRAKLRRYVELGGTLFAEACCGHEEFRRGFQEFAATTFPEVPLHELGPAHPIYHVLRDTPPSGLMGIDFGCRTSVIYSPNDLSCLWEQTNVPDLSPAAFQLGANIAAYAVGRRPLTDRLDVVLVPKSTTQAAEPENTRPEAFRLTQVVYEGDWRPFPLALKNLADFLRTDLNFDVVPQARQIRLTDQDLFLCPVLVLSGHFAFDLAPAERAALAAHLRRGGFLLAEACCGTEPFDGALRRLLQETFPNATLERLPRDHPIFLGKPGFDVTTVHYSPDIRRAHPDLATPELWGLRINGRLAVVYSPYSLSCGLSGPAFEGCWGLASEDAQHLAANIVLYALTH
jgi:hypothetical protein